MDKGVVFPVGIECKHCVLSHMSIQKMSLTGKSRALHLKGEIKAASSSAAILYDENVSAAQNVSV